MRGTGDGQGRADGIAGRGDAALAHGRVQELRDDRAVLWDLGPPPPLPSRNVMTRSSVDFSSGGRFAPSRRMRAWASRSVLASTSCSRRRRRGTQDGGREGGQRIDGDALGEPGRRRLCGRVGRYSERSGGHDCACSDCSSRSSVTNHGFPILVVQTLADSVGLPHGRPRPPWSRVVRRGSLYGSIPEVQTVLHVAFVIHDPAESIQAVM